MEALSDEELIARYRLAPASDESRQFIDELFRANGLMQDALLPLANTGERAAEHNGGMIRTPCKAFFSASNHTPDAENEQAQALVDRITLMQKVEAVKADDSFKDLIERRGDIWLLEPAGGPARR